MKRLLVLALSAACAPTSSPPSTDLHDAGVDDLASDTDVHDTYLVDTGAPDTAVGDTDASARTWAAARALAEIASEAPELLFLSEGESAVSFGVIDDGGGALPTVLTVRDRLSGIWDAPAYTTALPDRFVEEQLLAGFFGRMTVEQDWWEDFDRDQQPHWLAIRDVFETGLTGATVFRLGEHDLGYGQVSGAIEIYVMGASSDGHLVWIHVRSIET